MAKNWYTREHARKSNAAKKAAYILREDGYKTKEGERFLGGGSENLPQWAESAQDFWATADKHERNKHNDELDRTAKIKDHQQRRKKRAELAPKAVTVAREYEIPLPRELTDEQCIELAKLITARIGSNHAYTWGVHRTPGSLSGIDNPHLHIMLSERTIDHSRSEPSRAEYFKKSRTLKSGAISGGYKKDPALRKIGHVAEVKKVIKNTTNTYLKEHSIKLSIDFLPNSRSVGHLGAATIVRAAAGKASKKMDAYIAYKMAPIRQAQANKEQQLKARAAEPPTVLETVITQTRNITAYVLHPFNKAKRSRKLKEIAQDDITMRLQHTKKRKVRIYTPKEIAWIPQGGWPYKNEKTGHIDMVMGKPDNYTPLTATEILDPANFAELVAWEKEDYGKICLAPNPKSKKAVYADKLTHELETKRQQFDEVTDSIAKNASQNLNSWAARNHLIGRATIKAPVRPGRDKTRKYFATLANRKASAQVEEQTMAEALAEAKRAEIIRTRAKEAKQQQENQRTTTHSRITRRGKSKERTR